MTILHRALPAFLFLLAAAGAQTWNGSVSTRWNDSANWTPATVPNASSAVAVFSSAGLDGTLTNELYVGGDVALSTLRFLPGTPRIVLYVDNTGGPASLTLGGAGVDNNSGNQKTIWLGNFNFSNPDPVTLTFIQGASAGDTRLIGIGSVYHIAFRDQSAAGSATLAGYNVDFYDQSTAGAAVFEQYLGSTVTFHDHSTVGAAQLDGASGLITFADSTSAGNAVIQRPYDYGSSASVVFRDHSDAGTAAITVYSLAFRDEATAGQAVLNNLGDQVYSSHGAYSTRFAALTFSGHANADSATINNNSLATLTFADQGTAGNSTITNTGTVIFAGQSSLNGARLIAGSGIYLQNSGYDQPAIPVNIGNVYFQDQASGGNGRIEITGANTVLDFSGLYAGNGTTGRAPLPATPTGPAVFPDDQSSISFGSITNVSPGGAIYLGGSVLAIGGDNRDMTLSARISDQGGRFGSAAGAPLFGGTLYKTGTGTLTLSNPDNSYAGSTAVFDGTLNLAGGTISNTYVDQTGRLTGTGLVRGSLYNGYFGTATLVSPGNSIGTITVTGDYQQFAIGTLRMEIASAASYDRLIVGGTATLAGTLNLSFLNGQMPVGNTSYDLLTAASRNGQFGTVILPTAGVALGTQVVYTPTGVSLQVTQKPFAGFAGGSSAATALGTHLDATLGTATGDYRNLITGLNTLSAPALAAALDALAPDRYAVLPAHGFLTAAAQQAARNRLFTGLRANPARGFDLIFEASHRSARFDALAGLSAAEATLDGGTVGGAWRNGAFALGASLGQEKGDATLDAAGSRADLKSLTPAVFFQYAPDRFFLNASAAFSHDDYGLRRRVVYSGFDQTAAAAPSGRRTDLAVTAGYAWRNGDWSWSPQAGLLHSRWAVDDFTETGATGANLAFANWSVSSLRTRAGFEVSASGRTFAPRLAVFWLHEMEDDRSFPAKFAGATGAAYAAPGRPADRDMLQAAVGFDWRLGHRTSFHATLAGARGGDSRLTADLSAGFQWSF